MALQGINMPLAVTGLEAVWQSTLRQFKMSDEEIRAFLSSPANLAWQWMTNLEGGWRPVATKLDRQSSCTRSQDSRAGTIVGHDADSTGLHRLCAAQAAG